MSRLIKVGIAQQGPFSGKESMEEIVERVTGLLDEAGEKGANITSLCELALGEFFPPKLRVEMKNHFIEIQDKRLKPIYDVARKHEMVVILPFAEKCGAYYFNSAAVIDADGSLLGNYRKIHMPAIQPSGYEGGTGGYEKFYFTPGDLGFPVFKTRYGTFGIQICYDRQFPEGSRALAIQGAEMIFMPVAYATYGDPGREGLWELPIRCRAHENGVYVVVANRAGNENGRTHVGKSMVVSPVRAEVIVQGSTDKEEVIVQEIDLENVYATQTRTALPWWRDRRPDQYKELVKEAIEYR